MIRLLTLALCSIVVALLTVGLQESALASNGFGVSKFTIETTQTEEITEQFQNQTIHQFLDVPYTFTQAGGHPYGLTATLEFNDVKKPNGPAMVPLGGDPKDVVTDLPPGLIGNPTAVPHCSLAAFTSLGGRCPAASQLGVAEIVFENSILFEDIYNLEPESGQSAEFGIPSGGSFNVVLTAHVVHSNGVYGLTVVSNGIPLRSFTKFKLTFWGVPADPSHDPERGRRCETDNAFDGGKLTCPNNSTGITSEGGESANIEPVPFLSMPADCTAGAVSATVSVDSWEEPGVFHDGPKATLPAATGCDLLSFEPTIGVSPDTLLTDAPVGLGVDLDVPQPEQELVPATPELRNAVVSLPPGLSINPGVVDGVQACNDFGPEGLNIEGPESEVLGPAGEPQLAPGRCPDSSIVGTAELVTPLLSEPVKGHLYLARPLCGGTGQEACREQDAQDGRLYRLYLELGGTGALANTGVNFKTAIVVSANLATGQLTGTSSNNPQLPFSELKLHLNGGPRASLANPQTCGEARTTSDLSPWSAPGPNSVGELVPGTADANPFSFYEVTGCGSPPPFNPAFTAGTVTPEAGIFTPFVLNLTRKDGEQDLARVQVHTPPGLIGMLSSVPLCSEPEAAAGTCPEASKIGTTMVASGAGSHPFEIGGNVYLTKSYKDAPFGLSIVTHAVAGPFNLGLVIVRARIDVDPETSTLTVTSDPLPQIVFGVPLRLQRISVSIDRPGFMFNPTSCKGMHVTANIAGSQSAVANVSSSFAVAGCKGLTFKPTFKVMTNAHTSRSQGASLDARVSFPKTAPGSEANIARVKVSLPKQLPSRLSTLQKACPAAKFNANPTLCPTGSIVGIAKASTPVLPVELSGPVYFVSHGGEKFPSLVVVLQGDGVRVDLIGETFISKAGITSSTFNTVPDVPTRNFELYLPQGKNSALAANAKLCSVKGGLKMPTEFVAQNNTVMHQTTKIAVVGCAPARAKGAAHRAGAKSSRSVSK